MRNLTLNIEHETNQSNEAMTSARQLQRATDALLVEANSSLARANEAIVQTEKTLADANSTLKTLQGIVCSISSLNREL